MMHQELIKAVISIDQSLDIKLTQDACQVQLRDFMNIAAGPPADDEKLQELMQSKQVFKIWFKDNEFAGPFEIGTIREVQA